MAKTVVGLMQSPQEAERVVGDLARSCNCDRSDIGLMARGTQNELTGTSGTDRGGSDAASGAMKGAGTGAAIGGVLGLVAGVASLAIPGIGPIIAAGPIASALAGAGIGAVAGGVIGGLVKLGVPEDEAHYYAEGVRRGGTLITVSARDDEAAECAAEVMRRHGALDIEERAAAWRQAGWSGRLAQEEAEENVLPVVEEELAVGKRQVSKGGVRVYSHIAETPVQETVNLREQHVDVERRPVDRPLGAGEKAFEGKAIEMTETAEEPVVQKKARVVEEVALRKGETQRAQTVSDKVRKTEVRVEKTGAGAATGARAGSPLYRGPERRRPGAPFTGTERRRAATH